MEGSVSGVIEHIAKGYLGERHDGVLYLVGRASEGEAYVLQPGDLYLPDVGGGVLVNDDLRDAIINKSFTGRLVSYRLLETPMRIMDEDTLT